MFRELESNDKVIRELGPLSCGTDYLKEAFHQILSFIPKELSNGGDCEDFSKFWIVAEKEEVKKRFTAPDSSLIHGEY